MNIIPLCCPCSEKEEVTRNGDGFLCKKESCIHSIPKNAFPISNGIPIMISESRTDTVCTMNVDTRYVERPFSKYKKLKNFLVGDSVVTITNCKKFLALSFELNKRPKILVVGGGERGSGTDVLWEESNCDIISFDIYVTNTVDVVCDAHYMPFHSDSFDAVWVQAVLEHVVEPSKVASEIYRVLKTDGIVYAETPFMQQVHEGAYDFTRFTVLGHRYLFKDFEVIEIGGNQGPEVVLAWAFRYFAWALTRNQLIGKILGIIFSFLMRPFSMLMSRTSLFDASSGVYFLGCKAADFCPPSHKELIALYRGQF